MSGRLRVLLLQLPPPSPDGRPPRENHPVGPACVALGAARGSPAGRVEIEVLDREIADIGSDAAILDAIRSFRPDVLGLALFVWNLVRSTWIAGEAKRAIPGLTVVAGGPEAVHGRSDLFERGIDIAVPGEGELPFEGLIARILDGGDTRRPEDFAGTPGLLFPAPVRGGPPFSTGAPLRLPSLADLGNPYIEGLIDARCDRFLYIETARGCRFRCTFCRYDAAPAAPQRTLSFRKVAEVLRHAAEARVREVFLLDPTLNGRRDAVELLRILDRGNPGTPGKKLFRYGGELAAELVDARQADLIARAGFQTVEAGLQSVSPAALRAVRRFHDRTRFLDGVRLLRERGVRVRVDLIAGLPEETLDSFRRGVDLIAENGIGKDVQVFELQVLPGTVLAAEAAARGIEHLRRPPYTVIRTPTMSEEDLARAIAYSEDVQGVSWTHPPALRRYGKAERIEVTAGGDWRDRLATHRRSFLALDARPLPFARAAEGIRGPLASWLSSNPFSSADVLLRADRPASLEALRRLVESIQPHDWTLGAAIYRRVWTTIAYGSVPADWLEQAGHYSIVKIER
jgi:radical SAM superfamily enzyme YgiQ (UPF0313 family)